MKSVPKGRRSDVLRSPRIAPEFQEPEFMPGAPDALQNGCTCDPHQNRYGAGQHEDGTAVYFPDQDCPLHGLEAIVKAGA
jgi:hypothetical protein